MRAWQLVGSFGIGNLKQNELPPKQLLDDEVRVAIRACSLNFRDILVVNGHYNPHQTLPLVPISDGAGVVLEVGARVKGFKPGDRVCATFSQNWDYGRVNDVAQNYTLGSPLPGMLAEEGIFKERGLIAFPSFLSFAEASTLPCAALTAFNALTQEAELKPGDTVLLEGTGGVSIFALQFAKVLGLGTIVLSSSPEKIARLKELGADHTINYKQSEDWPRQVMEITGGRGVDAVLDVGGQTTLNKAIRSTKRGGAICLIGILGGTNADIEVVPILMRQLRLLGVFVGSRSIFEAMNRVVEHTRLRPVISKIYAFDEAPVAFHSMASGEHFGKICIRVGEDH